MSNKFLRTPKCSVGKQITTLRVDVEIIESGKTTLRIQVYPHMCGTG